jgi:hypothetical protein
MDNYVSKPIHAGQMFEAVEELAAEATEVAPADEPDEPGDRLIERQALLTRIDGDLDLLRKMVEPFLADCDCAQVERTAHFLKGSVGNFCAPAVFDAALRLERMARSGDLTGAHDGYADLAEGIDRLKRELMALLEVPVGTGVRDWGLGIGD